MRPVLTDGPFYFQLLVKCLPNSGKNIAHKLSVLLHLNITNYKAMLFQNQFSGGKNLALRLNY